MCEASGHQTIQM